MICKWEHIIMKSIVLYAHLLLKININTFVSSINYKRTSPVLKIGVLVHFLLLLFIFVIIFNYITSSFFFLPLNIIWTLSHLVQMYGIVFLFNSLKLFILLTLTIIIFSILVLKISQWCSHEHGFKIYLYICMLLFHPMDLNLLFSGS